MDSAAATSVLLASLACEVMAVVNQPDRYLVIDDYKRVADLEQLGWDTVEAVIGSQRSIVP